ncbi:MAG: DUF2851 family protein [Rikenellaceae bacterium]
MDATLQRAYKRLESDSTSGRCGLFLSSLSELERLFIYNSLEYERLERKHDDMLKLYMESGENWHQTLFTSIFKILSCEKNREAYLKLAQRVGYNPILREGKSLKNIETILLGASGILELYPKDAYILAMRCEAQYLMRKYKIEPMHYSEWRFDKVSPYNHPAIRLAQIARLFSLRSLFFDDVIACKTLDDVVALFGVEASDYWTSHFIPGVESKPLDVKVKRIGRQKCNLIGINVVVILQYAYGLYTKNEQISDRAERLNESLEAEYNTYIKRWGMYRVKPKNAFDSQALIQLYTVYCKQARCRECPVGVKAVKNLGWIESYK